MKINQALNLFLKQQIIRGNTVKTQYHYKKHIGFFITFLNKNIDIEKLKYNHYENYILYLKSKNLSSRTIYTYASDLKIFIHFCEENNLIKENIYSKIKLPKYKRKVINILSDNQIKIILNYWDKDTFIGARNLLIISLMLDSLLRVSEVINLSYMDFDVQKMTIKINGKGQKQRFVPLTPSTLEYFNNYLTFFGSNFFPTYPFFVDINCLGIGVSCIQSFFKRMRFDLNFEKFHPHFLRHTGATKFLLNGGDSLSLQLILGHTTLTMTEKYVHLANQLALSKQSQFCTLSNLN